MIKLSFNKGEPSKDGRYLCLIESKGEGFSLPSRLPETIATQYVCCGNWSLEAFGGWMVDNPNVFRIHNGVDNVIGWCEFEI